MTLNLDHIEQYRAIVNYMAEHLVVTVSDIHNAGVTGRGRVTTSYRMKELENAGVIRSNSENGARPQYYEVADASIVDCELDDADPYQQRLDALFKSFDNCELDESSSNDGDSFLDRVADIINAQSHSWVAGDLIAKKFGADVDVIENALKASDRFVMRRAVSKVDGKMKSIFALKAVYDHMPPPEKNAGEPVEADPVKVEDQLPYPNWTRRMLEPLTPWQIEMAKKGLAHLKKLGESGGELICKDGGVKFYTDEDGKSRWVEKMIHEGLVTQVGSRFGRPVVKITEKGEAFIGPQPVAEAPEPVKAPETVTPNELAIMRVLDDGINIATWIADEAKLSVNVVRALLKRLETKGLVGSETADVRALGTQRCSTNQYHGGATDWHLTDAGEKIVQRVADPQPDAIEPVTEAPDLSDLGDQVAALVRERVKALEQKLADCLVRERKLQQRLDAIFNAVSNNELESA